MNRQRQLERTFRQMGWVMPRTLSWGFWHRWRGRWMDILYRCETKARILMLRVEEWTEDDEAAPEELERQYAAASNLVQRASDNYARCDVVLVWLGWRG